MPAVAKPPVILSPLSSTSRVMKIGLSSKTLTQVELSTLARWTIRPRLMAVPGVANVAIWGQRDRQFQVLVEPGPSARSRRDVERSDAGRRATPCRHQPAGSSTRQISGWPLHSGRSSRAWTSFRRYRNLSRRDSHPGSRCRPCRRRLPSADRRCGDQRWPGDSSHC